MAPAPPQVALGFTIALIVILIRISLTDFREMRIPNVWNGLLLGLGLLACVVMRQQSLTWGVLSSTAGLIVMMAIREFYRWGRNKDGLGLGDVKFVAAAASWIGFAALPHMILLSSLAALCWVGRSRMTGQGIGAVSQIPFGPFLSAGLLVVWIMKVLT